MRSAFIATRNKSGLSLFLNGLERISRRFGIGNFGGIRVKPYDYKVVLHEGFAIQAVAFADKLFFRRLGMDQQTIGIAAFSKLDSGTGTVRSDFQFVARFRFKKGLQIRQES